MPNVAHLDSRQLSSESRLFPASGDLELLNRPFRRGRRLWCLDKADEFDGLSP
jgi:hypothetical protein